MADYLIDVNATVQCPHGTGRAQINSANTRVKVEGQPVALLDDAFLVSGCAFMVGTKPQPCVKLEWSTPAKRLRIGGKQVLLKSSQAQGQSAEKISQGPASLVKTQQRVKGT